tara:strand:- start:5 stop:1015 length:1011 start_codon:yes stop_codon:yes gene_type:complete
MNENQDKKFRELFSIKNLITQINTDQGLMNAADNVNLSIGEKEIFGLVGESGCGKTITAKSILQILPKNAKIISGEIKLENVNILKSNNIKEIRGKVISMIFQEPMVSLNPVFTIGAQIEEILKVHFKKMSSHERKEKVLNILEQVGIPSPKLRIKNYPFELSGGMRQRAMIAMALVCGNPKLLIADEPTTALDVTIQAQILDLIKNLVNSKGMSVLLITHDLRVIAETATRMAVMYAGSIVESGYVKDIFNQPIHPYTSGLIKSLAFQGKSGEKKKLFSIQGNVPNLIDLKPGCKFFDRCSFAKPNMCLGAEPELTKINSNHYVRCARASEINYD